ncbi:hypothetical protein M9Y10_005626 [Tritrichomonas musculus]|uniref:Myb-like DNA-binding domain containing protein n=1 Tax=Tritrichomonas musculus TaxID=1915356 RepID=A0ABR2JCP5_9EUKA
MNSVQPSNTTAKKNMIPFQYVLLNSYPTSPIVVVPYKQFFPLQVQPSKQMQTQSLLIKKTQINKKKFTPEEDSKIVELVGNEQFPCWQNISQQIPGKTARQCRERYQHYLSPKISTAPWTEEENQLLDKLQQQYGNNWAKITEYFKGRTNTYLKNKWNLQHRKQESEDSRIIPPKKIILV